ncbi:small-conductance mechanosensitive channel [Robertmurraya sp. P23]|uniref:small-conductance mechanosensitive channel n=1 Tax=Robertmurraya sp. P23 TaxID=3436931 RepID=UPI003D962FD3
MAISRFVEVASRSVERGSEVIDMDTFHKQSDFWGRLTLWTLILLSFVPPLYFSFVLGYHPGWSAILGGLVGYAAFVGVMWFLEPITYYPILGKSGTYIAFLTGNIANMCLPCSASAQEAVGAEPGTKKAEIAGTLGIATASLTNIIVVILSVLGGTFLLSIIPQPVEDALKFILPAIFGGVLGQFAMKKPLYGLIAFAIGMAVFFSPITALIKLVLCVALTVSVVLFMEKLKGAKSA